MKARKLKQLNKKLLVVMVCTRTSHLLSCMDSVSGTRKKSRSLVTLKSAGKDVQNKAHTVIPFDLRKEITNKLLQKVQQPLKGWLVTKPIHPKGRSVRLPTQYESREINLLFLVQLVETLHHFGLWCLSEPLKQEMLKVF